MKKILLIAFLILIGYIGYFHLSERYLLNDSKKNSHYMTLKNVSPLFTEAIVDTEDKRFYHNIGVDPHGILRAFYVGAENGKMTEGASTITQQLVKNQFLTQEKTAKRKLEEIGIALFINAKYSKQDILEQYINTIYFGDGAYGIYDASMDYFHKNPSELTLDEAALLAGLPQAPSVYDPKTNQKLALERRNMVLQAMKEQNHISESVYEKAIKEPIVLP